MSLYSLDTYQHYVDITFFLNTRNTTNIMDNSISLSLVSLIILYISFSLSFPFSLLSSYHPFAMFFFIFLRLYTVHNQHTLPGLALYRYIESQGKCCIGCVNIFCYHQFTTTMREKKNICFTHFLE